MTPAKMWVSDSAVSKKNIEFLHQSLQFLCPLNNAFLRILSHKYDKKKKNTVQMNDVRCCA